MRWWYLGCKLVLRISGCAMWKLRAHGTENVPKRGGVLLAANHQSYLDPPMVGSCLDREIHYLARKTLFDIPILGRVIVAMNAFPIARDSRDVKGVKTAIDRLRNGAALLVFPEGTRTRDGRIGRMKAGIRLLAERAAVPIVPVLIDGAYQIWPKGRPIFHPLGEMDIVFGRPHGLDIFEGENLRDAVLGLKREIPRHRR